MSEDNYLTHSHGIKSWIFSLDHKRIGLMYMAMVLMAFLLGGTFAVTLRTFLWNNDGKFFGYFKDPNQGMIFYNNMFSLHGAVMVFMFMIPAIPAILGNFVLPMMLGAKDVAFPRLNLMSLWIYALGACFFSYVLLGGVMRAAFGWHWPGGFGLDTGWTFYTPYSTAHAEDGVIPATLGAFILGFSSIL
ncbi:MAG: cbb3-type cytochrome c oxidase subunit I, partial [Tepidisphaeraceae bacterium]